MRLMTYNILTGGEDAQGSQRVDKILQVVQQQAPDILALNECNHFERDGYQRFYAFERALGMRGVLGLAPSGFHVAVFARGADFLEHRVVSDWVQHAILRVKLRLHGRLLTVVSAHLNPFGGEMRLSEAQYLAGSVHHEEHVLVAGDLNALSPHDAAHYQPQSWAPRRRVRHLIPGTAQLDTRAIAVIESAGLRDMVREARVPFTPTALTPLRHAYQQYPVRIDYLFGTPPLAESVRHAQVVRGGITDEASDHYPVVVDC